MQSDPMYVFPTNMRTPTIIDSHMATLKQAMVSLDGSLAAVDVCLGPTSRKLHEPWPDVGEIGVQPWRLGQARG